MNDHFKVIQNRVVEMFSSSLTASSLTTSLLPKASLNIRPPILSMKTDKYHIAATLTPGYQYFSIPHL